MATPKKRAAESGPQLQPTSKKSKVTAQTLIETYTPKKFTSLPRGLRQMILYKTYGDRIYKYDSYYDFVVGALFNDDFHFSHT